MGMNTPATASSVDQLALITAGHHFLMDVLPFRNPGSDEALAAFVEAIKKIRQPSAIVDAVLLRCLVVLDTQDERRIPSLVDRYLARAATPDGSLNHFTTCVEELLRYRCVSNGAVQQAIDIIDSRYSESSLDPRAIADALSLRLSTLDVAFRRDMGYTITEHLRGVRLSRAALLLVTTHKSIKEIWAEVGYNHASNFDHEFKRRFGKSPREFRAGSIRPAAQRHYGVAKTSSLSASAVPLPQPWRVLVVDHDEKTRRALEIHLTRKGYSLALAATGNEGLARVAMTCPDVILLEFRLGDMDAVEFLRELRSRMPGDAPAVALFTADWAAFDQREDMWTLHAVLASKLCDLNGVTRLIEYLCTRDSVRTSTIDVHMSQDEDASTVTTLERSWAVWG
jgi:AraC-like DNA-binding protein/CheY-like chemotaxis protein